MTNENPTNDNVKLVELRSGNWFKVRSPSGMVWGIRFVGASVGPNGMAVDAYAVQTELNEVSVITCPFMNTHTVRELCMAFDDSVRYRRILGLMTNEAVKGEKAVPDKLLNAIAKIVFRTPEENEI